MRSTYPSIIPVYCNFTVNLIAKEKREKEKKIQPSRM